MAVEITASAADRFKQLITDPAILPRLEIKAGGCNGFEKRFSMDAQRADDVRIDLPNGAALLIDQVSYDMLYNSTIDFKRGIFGENFTVEIPESTSTCGCGDSFSL